VSARAYAKRISGTTQPRIVVLRPAAGIGATTVTSASLPVSSAAGALASVADLHLPVQAGDAIGFLFPTGEIDLGARNRPNPDGAVVTFSLPCAPCGQDGGTGTELLFDGTVEPDFDADLLGDETQDPDGGGISDDYQPDPLFDDDPFFDEGEEIDDSAPKTRRRLRLLRVRPRRDGGVNLLLAVPRPGRLTAGVKARIPIATARKRVKKAGRVRLALSPSRGGRRLLARHHGPLRARLTVTLKPGKGRPRSLKAPVKLGGLLPKRPLKRPLARLE
jgi:hypothetical protein